MTAWWPGGTSPRGEATVQVERKLSLQGGHLSTIYMETSRPRDAASGLHATPLICPPFAAVATFFSHVWLFWSKIYIYTCQSLLSDTLTSHSQRLKEVFKLPCSFDLWKPDIWLLTFTAVNLLPINLVLQQCMYGGRRYRRSGNCWKSPIFFFCFHLSYLLWSPNILEP